MTEEESIEYPLYTVSDNIVQDRARTTLPDILSIDISHDQPPLYGVYAKCRIPFKTQFGPLDAPLAPYLTAKQSSFLMKPQVQGLESGQVIQEINSNLYYDTSQAKHCNWMCLVRPAYRYEEQNMAAHSKNQQVYFTTIRCIEPKEELRIWYSPSYAQFMSERLLSPTLPTTHTDACTSNDEGTVRYLRSRRSRRSAKQVDDVDYMEKTDDVDVRSVPPKKRGWKRANRQIATSETTKPSEESNPSYETVNRRVSAIRSEEVPALQDKVVESAQTNNQLVSSGHNRLFTCTRCGKSFAKKYTLKMHMTTHSDVYDFYCTSCDKTFKRKDKLNEHMKRMHLNRKLTRPRTKSNKPPFVPKVQPSNYESFLFKCLRCSIGFQRRGMLINHFVKQHPDVDPASIPEVALPILKEDISYQCLYCDKSYKSNGKRKRHIEKHHPGRCLPPSKVTTCSEHVAGIASKGVITLEPVLCPYCPSQYTSRAKMLKHVSSKHPDTDMLPKHTSAKKKRKVRKTKKSQIARPKKTLCSLQGHHQPNSVPVITAPSAIEDNSTEISNADKILRMLDDVPPISFEDNEIRDPALATQSISNSNFMNNQTSHITQMPHVVEPALRIMNHSEHNFHSSPVITGPSGSYHNHQDLQFIEETTSTQVHNSTLQAHRGMEETFTKSINQPPTPTVYQDKTNPACQRQLPLTYIRGRKLLILQAMNDERRSVGLNSRQQEHCSARSQTKTNHQVSFPAQGASFNSAHNEVQQHTAPPVQAQYTSLPSDLPPPVQSATTLPCGMNWTY